MWKSRFARRFSPSNVHTCFGGRISELVPRMCSGCRAAPLQEASARRCLQTPVALSASWATAETRGRFGKLEIPESTLPYFAETEETVNLKLKSLLYHSIHPILCVGETLAEREAGRTDEVIAAQLKGAFEGVEGAEYYDGVVAYEPVWAIGTGQTCDSTEASRVCTMIRGALRDVR